MKKTTGFEKFTNKKKAGTVKEAFKAEKRHFKKEMSREIAEKKAAAAEKKLIKREDVSPVKGRSKADVPAKGRGVAGAVPKGRAAAGRHATGPVATPAGSRGRADASSRSAASTSDRAAGKPESRKPTAGLKSNAITGGADKPFDARAAKTGSRPAKTEAPSARVGASAGSPKTNEGAGELMPLNKFIAHAGICARRDAAALVKTGVVSVNGTIVAEPGFKVTANDDVKVNGKKIRISQHLVYVLLNKPKDYITTVEDPQGRKTVLDLIKTATTERVYPVGRLDRNTSGVLLLTNDGDLAQQLSHPKHEIRKIYEVRLDKALTKADFDKIREGLTLEDGFILPDAIGYADPRDKSVIGIEIHSGRNRIVRRIFEHLKYDVRGLDRVMFAGLTKKNVNRGKWRLLAEKEVRLLKHFNKK